MIVLSLGSNIEPRLERLQQAQQKLQTIGRIVQVSPIYETEPLTWPKEATTNLNWFLNQIVVLETTLAPQDLLRALKQFETDLGRQQRRVRWSDREIDIDILLYHEQLIDDPNLCIPHPQIPHRRFVLTPLNDIAPDLVELRTGKTIKELLVACTDPLAVRAYKPVV